MLGLVIMSLLMGVASFGAGMLPLSFVFSGNHLSRLTTLGTGLLLGTALGVIIPEGIEALQDAKPSSESELPTSKIALSLLCGFVLMLIIEQLISPHSHSHSDLPLHNVSNKNPSTVEFDAELGEIEREEGGVSPPGRTMRSGYSQVDTNSTHGNVDDVSNTSARSQAIPLTLGLAIHSLADGLALGVSFFPTSNSTDSSLSAIVFLAIIIHKLPTSLALTTSLLATSLPRPECKQHLAVFSASTPISAIATYAFLSFFGSGDHPDWTGIALLFSGGTFLNVATMVSSHSESNSKGDMTPQSRIILVVIGMFIPFILSSLLGHGH
ncbi:hypothetical protein D9758_002598 [Tetrapyrgos nigripes]|uniref:Zinc/iron permease n=1 Tax=Tetrapyrgos nigripes TaxID=182062 RepID=A0A8H5GR23_9AGAR|nr:hypothetical protein D9758_002598 [Tetrapyrgos nigripes]